MPSTTNDDYHHLYLSYINLYRKEKYKMNTHFFLLFFTIHDDAHRPLHVFIYMPQADKMKWTCVSKKERKRESNYHTHINARHRSVFTRRIGYSLSKGRKREDFFSLTLSLCVSLLDSHSFNHQSCRRATYVRRYLNVFWLF